MAIIATHLTSSYDNVDRVSYTTASISPTANRWVVIDTYSRITGTNLAPTITGLSLTWIQEISRDDSTNDHRITRVYANTGGTPGSGAITISFGAVTQEGCGWIVYEFNDGVDATDPFVQSASAEGGASSVTVTLAAFSGDNRPLIAASHRANEESTPEAGYTEIGDVFGSAPIVGFAAAYHGSATDTTPSYSWATGATPSIAVASEVKAAVGGGGPLVARRALLGIGT